MGDPTGFMNYERKLGPDRDSCPQNRRLGRVSRSSPRKRACHSGREVHGLRGFPFCQTGQIIGGLTAGVSHKQSYTRVERPDLLGPLERGSRETSQDKQFPRVHGPDMPRSLRGIVRSGHKRTRGNHKEHRVRHRRQGFLRKDG